MNKILNIVGPQGCGKSTLAETIAQFIGGTVNHITLRELNSKFTPWLHNRPSVVIIEAERDVTYAELHLLKAFATSASVDAHFKYEESAMVDTPRFIVCSAQPIADVDDRRILLIGGAV